MVPSSATCATTMRSLLDTGVIKAELSELSAPLKFHQLADAPDPRTRYRPAPVPPSSHSPNSVLSEPETSTGTPFPVMVACRELACPVPVMNPLAGPPPSRLAFSLGTWTLLFTVSGGLPLDADKLKAVPCLFDSEETLVAVLDRPRMNV